MSRIVWDAENGWHDGPGASVRQEGGRIVIDPTLCRKCQEAPGCHVTDFCAECGIVCDTCEA